MARKVKQQSIDTYVADVHGAVVGRVVRIGSYHVEAKGKEAARDSRFIVFHAEGNKSALDGRFFRLYESAGLGDLFEHAVVGDFVQVEYVASKLTKNNRTMKVFNTQVWTDDESGPLPVCPPDPWDTKANASEATGAGKTRRR